MISIFSDCLVSYSIRYLVFIYVGAPRRIRQGGAHYLLSGRFFLKLEKYYRKSFTVLAETDGRNARADRRYISTCRAVTCARPHPHPHPHSCRYKSKSRAHHYIFISTMPLCAKGARTARASRGIIYSRFVPYEYVPVYVTVTFRCKPR